MRFLTPEVYRSWYDDYESAELLREAFGRCRTHLRALQDELPPHLLQLAFRKGADDALVVQVRHSPSERRLELVLRCGDLQVGYYDLTLTYTSARISAQDLRKLARVARTTRDAWRRRHDLYFHEVDLGEHGGFEHRLLFHGPVWVGIRCSRLEWTAISRPDREIPRLTDRFPGGPGAPYHRQRLMADGRMPRREMFSRGECCGTSVGRFRTRRSAL